MPSLWISFGEGIEIKDIVCPICGEQIRIEEISAWDAETGEILESKVNCSTEPDMDSEYWQDWHNWHWAMPYVDWLPVEERVVKWLNSKYSVQV